MHLKVERRGWPTATSKRPSLKPSEGQALVTPQCRTLASSTEQRHFCHHKPPPSPRAQGLTHGESRGRRLLLRRSPLFLSLIHI